MARRPATTGGTATSAGRRKDGASGDLPTLKSFARNASSLKSTDDGRASGASGAPIGGRRRGGGGSGEGDLETTIATTTTTARGDEDGAMRCELCDATRTSRWRRAYVDARTNALSRANDRGNMTDAAERGELKQVTCCKGCFQKKLRERTLLDRDKCCVECKSNESTDWHKKDKTTGGPPDLCNACYERGRRQDTTKGGRCSKCEKTTTRPLLKLPGSLNGDKCCSGCYHQERYHRLRQEQTSCVRCSTTTSTKWRKVSSVGPSDTARMCITCWRKENHAVEPNGREPPRALLGEPYVAGCAFCESKVSCAWRKSDGKLCCSACYQRHSRQVRKSRCTNCNRTPDKTLTGWMLNAGYTGVCPECRAAVVP